MYMCPLNKATILQSISAYALLARQIKLLSITGRKILQPHAPSSSPCDDLGVGRLAGECDGEDGVRARGALVH